MFSVSPAIRNFGVVNGKCSGSRETSILGARAIVPKRRAQDAHGGAVAQSKGARVARYGNISSYETVSDRMVPLEES
jgi:hypothetical protein